MSKRFILILGLATLFTMTLLVVGAVAPKATNPYAKTLYVSALSNLAVGTAVAAAGGCNKRSCEVLQGLYFCRSSGAREFCHIVNSRCSTGGC